MGGKQEGEAREGGRRIRPPHNCAWEAGRRKADRETEGRRQTAGRQFYVKNGPTKPRRVLSQKSPIRTAQCLQAAYMHLAGVSL